MERPIIIPGVSLEDNIALVKADADAAWLDLDLFDIDNLPVVLRVGSEKLNEYNSKAEAYRAAGLARDALIKVAELRDRSATTNT